MNQQPKSTTWVSHKKDQTNGNCLISKKQTAKSFTKHHKVINLWNHSKYLLHQCNDPQTGKLPNRENNL